MVGEDNAQWLERLLRALADANDHRPGIITASLRNALADRSWLTAEALARLEISSLATSIGVTPAMIAQRRAQMHDQSKLSEEDQLHIGFEEDSTDKGRLESLIERLEYADPTTEEVAGLLAGEAPNFSEALWQADKRARADERSVARTEVRQQMRSQLGKSGAAARHARHIAARGEIRTIWAKGNFETRTLCAEEECGTVGLKYDAARKALQGTPDPDPWPAKTR